MKEKTTTLTTRSFSKSLETNQLDGNQIATDTLINGTITNAKKCAELGTISNNTANVRYFKLSGLNLVNLENVFLLQSRAGELLIISCGHGDGTNIVTPKIKRLLDVHSKIGGFTYSGTDIYMQVNAYSHECIFSQLCGNSVCSLTITETTQSVYNSGTAIPIET